MLHAHNGQFGQLVRGVTAKVEYETDAIRYSTFNPIKLHLGSWGQDRSMPYLLTTGLHVSCSNQENLEGKSVFF